MRASTLHFTVRENYSDSWQRWSLVSQGRSVKVHVVVENEQMECRTRIVTLIVTQTLIRRSLALHQLLLRALHQHQSLRQLPLQLQALLLPQSQHPHLLLPQAPLLTPRRTQTRIATVIVTQINLPRLHHLAQAPTFAKTDSNSYSEPFPCP